MACITRLIVAALSRQVCNEILVENPVNLKGDLSMCTSCMRKSPAKDDCGTRITRLTVAALSRQATPGMQRSRSHAQTGDGGGDGALNGDEADRYAKRAL